MLESRANTQEGASGGEPRHTELNHEPPAVHLCRSEPRAGPFASAHQPPRFSDSFPKSQPHTGTALGSEDTTDQAQTALPSETPSQQTASPEY